jgi:hypothetical protein
MWSGGIWTAPFAVDNTFGHHFMPVSLLRRVLNNIKIAYETCINNFRNACAAAFREITGGSTTVGGVVTLSSTAFPEAEANRSFFQPLDGDYIGLSAHNGHAWFGYADTLRSGTYGFGTVFNPESNNNIAAQDGS